MAQDTANGIPFDDTISLRASYKGIIRALKLYRVIAIYSIVMVTKSKL